jgi:xylose isomerase
LDKALGERYSGWEKALGKDILNGKYTLAGLAAYTEKNALAPSHRSGHQERLENLINQYLYS